jgi:hypothetical protein
MDYQFDVFISYRRLNEWPEWIKKHFFKIFQHWLDEELGKNCRISIDYNMETGHSWPAGLANDLSRSKVLVPLWSPQYFNSTWCLKEMSLFVAREKMTGFGTAKNSQRLIVPAVIHDKDSFPDEAKLIQFKEIQPYCNIRVGEGSKILELLSENIRDWVPDICNAINKAPPFDPEWKMIAYVEFMKLFRISNANNQMPRL